MFFNYNPFSVLSEASKLEALREECDKHDDDHDEKPAEVEKDEVEQELEDELDDTEEMEDDVKVTAEMVNLFYDGNRYYIESSDLVKVMDDDEEIEDAEEAIEKVKEANNLSKDDVVAVMIESKDVIAGYIAEAKAAKRGGKEDAMDKLKDSTNFLKNTKNKGITVVAKRSKK